MQRAIQLLRSPMYFQDYDRYILDIPRIIFEIYGDLSFDFLLNSCLHSNDPDFSERCLLALTQIGYYSDGFDEFTLEAMSKFCFSSNFSSSSVSSILGGVTRWPVLYRPASVYSIMKSTAERAIQGGAGKFDKISLGYAGYCVKSLSKMEYIYRCFGDGKFVISSDVSSIFSSGSASMDFFEFGIQSFESLANIVYKSIGWGVKEIINESKSMFSYSIRSPLSQERKILYVLVSDSGRTGYSVDRVSFSSFV